VPPPWIFQKALKKILKKNVVVFKWVEGLKEKKISKKKHSKTYF